MHMKRQRYYSYMFCSEDRVRLYKEFKGDKKNQVLVLYEKNDFNKLEEYLEEYISKIQYYARLKVSFCFDPDIFGIALSVMLDTAFKNSSNSNEFKRRSTEIINIIDYTDYRHFDSVENVFWGEREEKQVLLGIKKELKEKIEQKTEQYYTKFDINYEIEE